MLMKTGQEPLRLQKKLGRQYRIGVQTAKSGGQRVQIWFELDEVTNDIGDIREAAPVLTAALCADAQRTTLALICFAWLEQQIIRLNQKKLKAA